MIVDAHIHLLPDRLGRAVRAFFDTHVIDTATFAYPLDHGVICDRLARDGITEAWTLPYVRRPGAADALNQATAAIVTAQRHGPVKIVGGCTVHPGDPDPTGVVRRAVEDLGARVLKLHCSVGDFEPDDPRLDPVWEYASQTALPVIVHAGHAPSGHTTAAELAPIGTVAQRHPAARVIIAHCGHRAAPTALDLVERYSSVYADLTPVVHDPVVLPTDRVPALAHKLLFGSDAPNTGFTTGQAIKALDALHLSAESYREITGGTAQRLRAEIRT